MALDETHDPARRSWVESANAAGCEFPVQNLPFGVFRSVGAGTQPRGGVAIGDQVLDVAAFAKALGFTGPAAAAAEACSDGTLNRLMSLGRAHWGALRTALSRALSKEAGWEDRRAKGTGCLAPLHSVALLVPARIGDYTDFYTSVFHATNVGRFFRPDNPLMPNYKWVPIGYHGRASSIVASGTQVIRPGGQLKAPAAEAPAFGACRNLDYETELGFFIGTGNDLGHPIPVGEAVQHVFGAVLLNDWSARDIQAWEYQPLGPFLAKNFATTISPWIVTMDALEPYRTAAFKRPAGDPAPLPYLTDAADQKEGGYSISVEMYLRSEKMRAAALPPMRLSRGNYRDAYWTLAQMVAHHASSGCNLQPGDLLGTGTLSGDTPDSVGSMLELTQRGANPVQLPSGETRGFVTDGDEVIQRGQCSREGYATIGFGEASGTVLPPLR
jgi:fumarylacetoacetase